MLFIYLLLIFTVGFITGVRTRPWLERRYYELGKDLGKSEVRGGEKVRHTYQTAIRGTFGRGQSNHFENWKKHNEEIYVDGITVVSAKDRRTDRVLQ
jgi:hypothetical protein